LNYWIKYKYPLTKLKFIIWLFLGYTTPNISQDNSINMEFFVNQFETNIENEIHLRIPNINLNTLNNECFRYLYKISKIIFILFKNFYENLTIKKTKW
jgi:hypothetical protein